ncbi:MAG TPA: YggS family pyridoxal phosphate-dependent enzyme [Pseudonocardiaceae bacterium]|nr:YggS family pyridoxal phosphate-dependent enzyme [Pseudonocardiaceae bacterium]
MTQAPTQARIAQLAESLAQLRDRIATAARAAGRDPAEVALLAVTKTFPATDVAALVDLGLADFGENRDQEAAGKVDELAALRPEKPVRWQMIGNVQRNKARSVVAWAGQVQSVDSARLVQAFVSSVRVAIDRGSRNGPLDVLVQASIDGDPKRGGCPLPDLVRLADLIGEQSELRLRGVMAVAPLESEPKPAFERLAYVVITLRGHHPEATELSIGMSGDLEAAIASGSTCVRVGTALLGGRRLASV